MIDANGNASVVYRAGVPTVTGKNYMTYIAHWFDVDMAKKLVQEKDMSAFRKWMNTGADMFGNGHPEGMEMLSSVTAEEITQYMMEGKKSLLKKVSQMDKQSFDVMMLPKCHSFVQYAEL